MQKELSALAVSLEGQTGRAAGHSATYAVYCVAIERLHT